MDNKWWLTKDKESVVARLSEHHDNVASWHTDDIVQAWQRNQIIYYSAVLEPSAWETSLQYTGEQGELIRMQVPQARSLIRQLISIVTKAKLNFTCIAETSGQDVLNDVRLGNALARQIVDEQRFKEKGKNTLEMAMVHGNGFLKSTWRTDKGRPYTGDVSLEFDGDLDITYHSVFDVFYDHKITEWKELPWVEVRTIKNRWDLIAQFPRLKQEILNLPSINEGNNAYTTGYINISNDDMIYSYELFVRPSAALPNGRMMMYSDQNTIYHDGDNVYDDIPVEEMKPESFMGFSFGYPFFSNLIPAQEMLDHSFSAIATNQSAFAVQNVAIPRGAGVSVQEIAGMNFISFTPQNVPGGGKPEPLQLTKSAPETFKFIDYLRDHMQQLSNINSALRGSPPPGVTSGVAIATLSTNALEFLDSAAEAYNVCMERTMMHAINAYRKFASVPHIVHMTGKNDQSYTHEFVGTDLDPINKVKLTISNPLMQTMAGRTDIAEKLVQSGLIKDVQQYISVLDGAPLEDLYKDELSENDLEEAENEALIKGEPVQTMSTDDHAAHIRSHASLLNDPKIRFNNDRVAPILEHIMEHLELSKSTDQMLTAMVRTGKMPEGGMPPPGGAKPSQPAPPSGELPPIPGQESPTPSAQRAMAAAQPADDLLGKMRM